MTQITIIGMGLIGGSLGMAFKNKDIATKVTGVSRNSDHLKEAKEKLALDDYTIDPIEASREADIIFICTPISSIIPMVKTIAPFTKKGCIITDVGSSKSAIVEEIENSISPSVTFIGGHPMAGSERAGITAAAKFLFEGTNYILTPTQNTDSEQLAVLQQLIAKLDAHVSLMDPKTHDMVVAGISHMPLAIAISLVNTIDEMNKAKEEMLQLASSGFRDTTRIAAGNPGMAVDMFTTNKEAVLAMIAEFKISLNNLEKLIKEGDAVKLEKEITKAAELRTRMYAA